MNNKVLTSLIAVTLSLSACTTTNSNNGQPVQKWTPIQTSYIELCIFQQAQVGAISVGNVPGLPVKELQLIKEVEKTSTSIVVNQAQVLANNGSASDQVMSALIGALSTASSSIAQTISTLQLPNTVDKNSPTASNIAIAGSIGLLSQAPQVLVNISKVNGGWTPVSQDIQALITQIQANDTNFQQ